MPKVAKGGRKLESRRRKKSHDTADHLERSHFVDGTFMWRTLTVQGNFAKREPWGYILWYVSPLLSLLVSLLVSLYISVSVSLSPFHFSPGLPKDWLEPQTSVNGDLIDVFYRDQPPEETGHSRERRWIESERANILRPVYSFCPSVSTLVFFLKFFSPLESLKSDQLPYHQRVPLMSSYSHLKSKTSTLVFST